MSDAERPGPNKPPRRETGGRGKVIPFPARPRWPEAGSNRKGELVEVHRCDQAEAVVVRSLFESEGIPVVMRSHVSQAVHPFSVGEQGGVAILVQEIEVTRSRRLLARMARRRSSR